MTNFKKWVSGHGLFVVLLAGLSFLTIHSPVRAALFIDGIFLGTIGSSDGNDVIETAFGEESFSGIFGGAVRQTGLASLQYDLLGFEAGYANRYFSFDGLGGSFDTEANGPSNFQVAANANAPLDSFVTDGVNGYLDFTFTVNSAAKSVQNGLQNGFNYFLSEVFNSARPNFFANRLTDGSVVLWLDDSGGGIDRDYDDMVIRISEVVTTPLPPALPLFLVGVASLAWWRKKQRSADPV